MTRIAILLVPLLLAGCQVYAGGGTLVSDGRTTTVRTARPRSAPRPCADALDPHRDRAAVDASDPLSSSALNSLASRALPL